jgi:hypothetical protein
MSEAKERALAGLLSAREHARDEYAALAPKCGWRPADARSDP